MKLVLRLVLLGVCLPLMSCASERQTTARIVDAVPTWLGGEPEGLPPRSGTLEYDAWMAKRAEEAARLKGKQ
jgi:hypothetical protein